MNQLNKKSLIYIIAVGAIILVNVIIFGFFLSSSSSKKTDSTMSDTESTDNDNAIQSDEAVSPDDSHYHSSDEAISSTSLKEAKDFELLDFKLSKNNAANTPLKLSSIQSKLIWIHLFTTWCPNCKKDFPSVKEIETELSKLYNEKQFKFIYLNIDENQNDIENYLTENNISYTTFIAKNLAEFSSDYEISAVPHNIIIKDGKHIILETGPVSYQKDKILEIFKNELSVE